MIVVFLAFHLLTSKKAALIPCQIEILKASKYVLGITDKTPFAAHKRL